MTDSKDGSSIIKTPFLLKLNSIASKVCFKSGIWEIVFAEKIISAFFELKKIFFAKFFVQKFG